jgi:hypothetical protein
MATSVILRSRFISRGGSLFGKQQQPLIRQPSDKLMNDYRFCEGLIGSNYASHTVKSLDTIPLIQLSSVNSQKL